LKTRGALETISRSFCYISCCSSGSLAFYLDIFKICAAILLSSHIFFPTEFFLLLHVRAHTKLALGINQTQCRAFLPQLKIDRHSGLRYKDDNGRRFNRSLQNVYHHAICAFSFIQRLVIFAEIQIFRRYVVCDIRNILRNESWKFFKIYRFVIHFYFGYYSSVSNVPGLVSLNAHLNNEARRKSGRNEGWIGTYYV